MRIAQLPLRHRDPNQRQGAMLVYVAVVMVLLLIAAVFTVDVAFMHMVRAELRTATDAAARAGAETLARTQSTDQAIQSAIDVGEFNQVAGDTLTLSTGDIEIGGVQDNGNGGFDFVPGLEPFTSVRVTGRRVEGAPDGPVALFFGRVFNQTTFEPIQIASATSSVRDIALVLDRSGSMRSVEGGISRINALKQAVDTFIREIEDSSPNSQISLTTYSTSATRDFELTNNFNAIRSNVATLPASGLTNIFQALQFGSDSLEQDAARREFAERTIVLMTDGNFNQGGTPVPSANVAASRDHTIHTITFSSGANQTIMKTVADIGGGIHIHADDAADLNEAFREIARTLSVLLVQ